VSVSSTARKLPGFILYLLEGFARTAYLEEILSAGEENARQQVSFF